MVSCAVKYALAQEQKKLPSAHTCTRNSWMCRGEAVPSRQELAWESRGGQGGTRWRPLQIWLLLKVLWSAHVYPLAHALILGAVWSMGQGPGSLWSEVDPSDYACGNCTFSFLWHPSPLPPSFFFQKMRFGGCRWGAFNVIVCFPPPPVYRLILAKQPSGTLSWLNT